MAAPDALTLAGAVRQALVTADVVRGRVFRDEAPEGVTFPYAVVHDYIGDVPAQKGDGRVTSRRRLLQVSLWQKARDESDRLGEAVLQALDRAALTDADDHVIRCRVTNVVRLFDEAERTVHHAFDVEVERIPATV